MKNRAVNMWRTEVFRLARISRRIGGNPDLVLFGGGNTSVKSVAQDALGHSRRALFIKPSGLDMARIEAAEFVALDLDALQSLRALSGLSDETMHHAFGMYLLQPSKRAASIETLLHAFIPKRFVVHTHPGIILALTNRKGGAEFVREAFGAGLAVIPYVKAGFKLALAAAASFQRNPQAEGMVLMQHGLVAWGDSAEQAYGVTMRLIRKAERFMAAKSARPLKAMKPVSVRVARQRYERLAPMLRGLLSAPLGSVQAIAKQSDSATGLLRCAHNDFDAAVPVVLKPIIDENTLRILGYAGAKALAVSAPLTPDYLIRTKAYPLWVDGAGDADGKSLDALRETLASAIERYRRRYDAYVRKYSDTLPAAGASIERDNVPRVLFIPGMGAVCAGPDAAAAGLVADITSQALRVKAMILETGGKYQGLPEKQLFDMEFRGIQRAKLEQTKSGGILAGRVAMVTGSAGAIGMGVCQGLLEAGAHVVVTDLPGKRLQGAAARWEALYPGHVLGAGLDVTDGLSVSRGFQAAVQRWGGVDIVVVNAGLAHVAPLDQLELETFRRLERVNVEGTLSMLAEAARHFKQQGMGGDIVLISTKNVFAPGAKFGAYSATKAAAHQLARIASLELAEIGVRVNMVAPDAVFSHGGTKSGLWAQVGPDRMRARGLDEKGLEEYYRQRNLLKARITARHVANAVLFFATRQTPTTGATLPVDGGLPEATPR